MFSASVNIQAHEKQKVQINLLPFFLDNTSELMVASILQIYFYLYLKITIFW